MTQSITTRLTRTLQDKALVTLVIAVLLYLYLPIIVLMVFSFNDSSQLTLPLQGFTLTWYEKMANNRDLLAAVWNSLYVACIATLLTLIVGVPAALALDRYDFPGKTLFRRLVLLPLVLPGIITGISLLSLFKILGVRLSLEAVIIGHATALLSVVVTQVFARLQRLNRNLEDAAADLGAKPMTVLLLVVLPNIRSAIIGSALLAFTLSFDEIPVTFFLTGRENTLPMYIWSTLRRGITPEINAVASLIMLGSFVLAMISVWLLRDER
uniref:RC216 n=1 Tax=Ruegeria sp. PR1b TaxID=185588 RepID=Q8KVX4_9RHOB|nr:ABC transporter permease [Ruegeria sp. PR1b]AAN05289.1 RC216 [Ruegeria sp. PR1b]